MDASTLHDSYRTSQALEGPQRQMQPCKGEHREHAQTNQPTQGPHLFPLRA